MVMWQVLYCAVCLMPKSIFFGIGGAPEGVAAAAAIRALGGDMQARLLPRNEVKGDTEENKKNCFR